MSVTACPKPKAWSNRRIARLGFLLGLGRDAKQIARDTIVNSTPGAVHKQTAELNLCFRLPVEGAPLNLSAAHMAYYDAEAKKRGLHTEHLLRQTLEIIAADRYLLGAIFEPGARSGDHRDKRP